MRMILPVLFVICLSSLACNGDTPTQSGEAKCPSAVSYGGKTYTTAQIGNQCWMKENLDIGVMIDSAQSAANNGIIEKYCYRNNLGNCNTYGGLYSWRELMQYSASPGVQGICPPGWHLPTVADFETLRTAAGDDGNALKAIGQGSGAGRGTNVTRFSALLGGSRETNGRFFYLNEYAHFWSTTEGDSAHSRYLYLDESSNFIGLAVQYVENKNYGFSVRCLED